MTPAPARARKPVLHLPPGPSIDFGDMLRRQLRGQRQALSSMDDLVRVLGGYDEGIAHYTLGVVHVYVVWDPALVQQVLVTQHAHFAKGLTYRSVLGHVMGNGLLLSDGDFWKRQRKRVQPAFHSARVNAYGSVMASHAARAVDAWLAAPGGVVDVAAEMQALTLGVVAKCLFDADVSSQRSALGVAMRDIAETFATEGTGVPLPPWLPTPRNRRQARAVRAMHRVVADVVAARRASGEDTGDLLSMLLRAQDDEGAAMTDRQLRDEIMTLFIAGHETTAVTLAWMWVLLSAHPGVLAALEAELDAVLAGRAPSVADLPHLPYTDAVVREVLRLYPAAPIFPRQAVQDTQIGGYDVPRWSGVVLAPCLAHRDARHFAEPERFWPERWLGTGLAQALPRYAYMPFGGGPRVCIGNHFAVLEAALILATAAQRARLALLPGQAFAPVSFNSLRPDGPVLARVVPRA